MQRRERGAQIVGDVRHHLPAQRVRLLQGLELLADPGRHLVVRASELAISSPSSGLAVANDSKFRNPPARNRSMWSVSRRSLRVIARRTTSPASDPTTTLTIRASPL